MARLRMDHALTATMLFVAMSLGVRADPYEDVRHAVDELDSWLGPGSNGERWRTFLDWDVLEQQLRRDGDPDPVAVAAVIAKYRADANGLDLPKFSAVRNALIAWNQQLIDASDRDLAQLARVYEPAYQPITQRRVGAARQRLVDALQTLDNWLGDDVDYRAGWRNYLHWDTLQDHAVGNQEPTAESLRQLAKPYKRLRANHEGLELSVFTNLADAVQQFTNLAAMSLARDQQRVYQGRIRELSDLLAEYQTARSSEIRFEIGRRLGWLAGIQQSPELLSAVRNAISHPNLFVDISAPAVARFASRPIHELRSVREVILGTRIRGTAVTTGLLSARPLRSPATVRIELLIEGTIEGRTTGHHPPVRVRNSSHTQYTAGALVEFDGSRFTSEPPWAQAKTTSQIHSIRKIGKPFLRKTIERAAWRRAQQQRGQANRVASRKAEKRIVQDFAGQISTALATATTRYRTRVSHPLRRRGETPTLDVSSDSDGLRIVYLQANAAQLGAPAAPPADGLGTDLRVRVHESTVDHFLNMLVGGRTLSRESLEKTASRRRIDPGELFDEIERHAPKPVAEEEEEPEPWSITLRAGRPISMRFDDGRAKFTIHGIRYVAGERRLNAWDISVSYQFEFDGSRIVLVRDGPAEILPAGFDPSQQKLSQAQSGLRNLIAQRIEREQAFPLRLRTKPLRLPGENESGAALPIAALSSHDGWLTVAWILP